MQDEHIDNIKNSGVRISLFTTFSLIAVFAIYGYLVSPANVVISSNVLHSMSNLVLAVFIFLIGALSALSYGIYTAYVYRRRLDSLHLIMTLKKKRQIDGIASNCKHHITRKIYQIVSFNIYWLCIVLQFYFKNDNLYSKCIIFRDL